jgi:hypothetical protein
MKGLVLGLMLLSNSVFAQYIQNVGMIDGATGNLVYTSVNPPPPGADPVTWSGFTGTTSTGGGYSGGYMPGYNSTTGTFMFGYSRGTIAYSTPVNYALAMAGTNIQVNGFKYSWEYINQDYSRGTLSGNINLTSNTGQVLQNYNYNMPQTTAGWTTMSGIENFNTQYAASSLGRLNVSFTGKDDRFWAGYYGPQIRDIDVKLLYSVAPPPVPTDFLKWVPLTNENGEFTLTKPGVVRYGANDVYVYHEFQAGTYSCTNSAWGIDPLSGVGKSCSLGTNTSTTTTPTVTKTTTTDTYTSGVTLLEPVTTASTPTTTTVATPTVDSTSLPTSSAPQTSVISAVVSAPAPTTSTSTTTASTSTISSTQSSKESSGSSGSTSLALSIISKNNERDAAGSAVAQSAMAQAQQAATQAQQDAANVASNAVSNSVSANAVSIGGQQSTGNGIRATSSGSSSVLASNASLSIGTTGTAQQLVISQQPGTTSVINTTTQSATAQTASAYTQQNVSTTMQTQETYVLVQPNTLTDRTNPLTDIVEGKQSVPQSNSVGMTGPAVNKNAQDNDIAGGVSINKMATAPNGYGDYLNFTMRDVAFYAPKEVYKNQRNVDNQRALRTLTSDSKHREMVEMQYAK